jgi:MFS family permease
LARAIFGAFGSASGPAAQAYVADRSTPARRTERIAALTAAFSIGAVIGPGVCAFLAGRFSLVVPILLMCGVAAIAAVLTWRMLPEPHKPVASAQRSTWRESARLAADERLAPFLIYGLGLSTVAGTLSQTFALYLMDKLDVRGEQAAELASAGFIVGALALFATQMGVIPWLRWTSRTYMAVGAVVLGAGVVLQLLAANLGGLIVSQLVQGVGFGLTRPGAAGGASLAVRPQEQGAAAGLVVAVNGAGFVISPITGGVFYDYMHESAPLLISLVMIAAMVAFTLLSRRLRDAEFHPHKMDADQP